MFISSPTGLAAAATLTLLLLAGCSSPAATPSVTPTSPAADEQAASPATAPEEAAFPVDESAVAPDESAEAETFTEADEADPDDADV